MAGRAQGAQGSSGGAPRACFISCFKLAALPPPPPARPRHGGTPRPRLSPPPTHRQLGAARARDGRRNTGARRGAPAPPHDHGDGAGELQVLRRRPASGPLPQGAPPPPPAGTRATAAAAQAAPSAACRPRGSSEAASAACRGPALACRRYRVPPRHRRPAPLPRPRRASPRWWAPTAPASPTSSTPCCLCLASAPSSCA